MQLQATDRRTQPRAIRQTATEATEERNRQRQSQSQLNRQSTIDAPSIDEGQLMQLVDRIASLERDRDGLHAAIARVGQLLV